MSGAVAAYFKGDKDCKLNYGSDVGKWCVDRVQSFKSVFALVTGSFTKMGTCCGIPPVLPNMASMFYDAIKFNGIITSFHTSRVTDMSLMFMGAVYFKPSGCAL